APASLYALLDPEGGAVRVGPAGTGRAAGLQSYDERTAVLRTRLPAVDGELEVADFMPWDGTSTRPPGRIVRVATAISGQVAVERSLLALKALTFHATGAVVASATTSLPEWIGGERNWDHRYAWLRDACGLVEATQRAGLADEAASAVGWLSQLLEGAGIPID